MNVPVCIYDYNTYVLIYESIAFAVSGEGTLAESDMQCNICTAGVAVCAVGGGLGGRCGGRDVSADG